MPPIFIVAIAYMVLWLVAAFRGSSTTKKGDNVENTETLTTFGDRIDPRKYNFSPVLVAIVGAILGFDYGVRDRKGGRLTSIAITSDGFVIAGSTAHDTGAFIGDVADLDRNISLWLNKLSPEDQAEFRMLYRTNGKGGAQRRHHHRLRRDPDEAVSDSWRARL
jgi:hypothetical protein